MKVYFIIMMLFSIGYAVIQYSAKPELRRYFGSGFYCCYALIIVAAANAPSALIYGLSCTVLIAATVRSRMDALCRTAMMVILVPQATGALVLGPMFLWQSSTIDFVLFALVAGLARAPRRGPRPPVGFTGEDALILVLFLVCWLGPSRVVSLSEIARSFTATFFKFVLPYILFRKNIRSSADVNTIAFAVACACLLSAIVGIYEGRTGWAPLLMLISRFNHGLSYGMLLGRRGDVLRPTAATGNPLVLAAMLVFGFTAIACSSGFFRSRKGWVGWLAIIIMSLVVAQSRGNLVCLVLAVILLLALSGRRFLAAIMAVAGLIGYEALFALAGSSPRIAAFLRVGDAANNVDGHYDYRGLLLERGMQEASKHMWLGTGIDTVIANMTDLTQGEGIIDFVNTYLWLYLVSGLVGVVSIAGLMLWVVFRLTMVRPGKDAARATARAFALVSFVVLMVELSFMSFIGCIPCAIALTLACSRTVRLDRTRSAGAAAGKPATGAAHQVHPGPRASPAPAPA